MKKQHFCNCGDLECPFNPNNPNAKIDNCDPCIRKNLKHGEIPACFFKSVSEDISDLDDFSYESFAKFILENKKK